MYPSIYIMPARYRHRKVKKGPHRRRRNMGRYRRHNKLVNYVPSGASPVAKKHIVKLKYSDVFQSTTVAGLNTVQTFRMNSVFDPDVTGVGHQPYGFDQLAALFAHYRVFRFKWHIEFAGSNDRLHVTTIPVNGLIVGTGASQLGEQPLAVTKAVSYAGGFPIIFRGSMPLPRFTGASAVQYRTDDRYSSTVTASPTESMQFVINIYNPTTVSVTTSYNITLTYYTEFYDPITQVSS